MASKPANILEIECTLEKHLKAWVRFSEINSDAPEGKEHKFYVDKKRWEKLGSPNLLHFRIEAGKSE